MHRWLTQGLAYRKRCINGPATAVTQYPVSRYTELEVDEPPDAADSLHLNSRCDKKYRGFHNSEGYFARLNFLNFCVMDFIF